MVTWLDDAGKAATTEPFAEGWISGMGTCPGRPVDVHKQYAYTEDSLRRDRRNLVDPLPEMADFND